MNQFLYLFSILLLLNSCKEESKLTEIFVLNQKEITQDISIENPKSFAEKLSNAALSIIDLDVIYTPAYVGIKYPNGDVPEKRAFVRM